MSENVLFLSDKFINGCIIFTPDDLKNKASQFANRNVVLVPYTPGNISTVSIDSINKALKNDEIYHFFETATDTNNPVEELFKDELMQARTNIKSLMEYITHIRNHSKEDLDMTFTIDAHEWHPYQVKLALLGIIKAQSLSYTKDSHYDYLRISATTKLVHFSQLDLSVISNSSDIKRPFEISDDHLMRIMWEIRKMSFIAKMHREIHKY